METANLIYEVSLGVEIAIGLIGLVGIGIYAWHRHGKKVGKHRTHG